MSREDSNLCPGTDCLGEQLNIENAFKKGARFAHSTHPFSGRIGLQLLCYSLLESLHCKFGARIEGNDETIVEFAGKAMIPLDKSDRGCVKSGNGDLAISEVL